MRAAAVILLCFTLVLGISAEGANPGKYGADKNLLCAPGEMTV